MQSPILKKIQFEGLYLKQVFIERLGTKCRNL